MTAPLLVLIGALGCYMTLLYALASYKSDNGIADVGYGIGFLVLTAHALFLGPQTLWAFVVSGMVLLWAARLSWRIARNHRGKPEDFRYRAWRLAWGPTFAWRSFLQVYLLQGMVIGVVALPVVGLLLTPTAFLWPAYFGFVLWGIGFLFEVIGDAQLDSFVRNRERTENIMKSGLWQYTRHPNYFGESLLWWGMATVAAFGSQIGVAAYVSPLLITYLLLYVSGVPLLEKRWEGIPEWEAYKARTSVFFPWPPTRSSLH